MAVDIAACAGGCIIGWAKAAGCSQSAPGKTGGTGHVIGTVNCNRAMTVDTVKCGRQTVGTCQVRGMGANLGISISGNLGRKRVAVKWCRGGNRPGSTAAVTFTALIGG